jgi:Ran GTPase-activating protein (RanGAP) involved in mRNA processing and transport
MFQPGLANKKSCGVHELIYYSLIKCDEKLRFDTKKNVFSNSGYRYFAKKFTAREMEVENSC